ncbi:AraC family transcriptional regulator [Coraliomargarita parva]|uniref:AraC family transcriptional regulator n=1 Tax=Coraliomargarita parva TaxID=3014050 RepID=UPI0022B40235|nr:AraC family transcriptional regulator [Coraliomargarita parva]
MVENFTPQHLRLSLHEFASLRNELIWAYDHAPGSLTKVVTRNANSGNWAWFIRTGCLNLIHEDRTIRVNPGQWILLPEGTSQHVFEENTHIISIHYRCQWPSGENLVRTQQGLVFEAKKFPELLKSATKLAKTVSTAVPKSAIYNTYHSQQLDFRSYLRIESLFLEWLGLWSEVVQSEGAEWVKNHTEDERLYKAIRILNKHPLSQKLPEDTLMEETGLSMVHLNRLMLNYSGFTIRKYWENRRLNMAQDALMDTRKSIKEIAYQLEFRSDSLFVNWFKRREGISPGQYREENTTQH